MLFAAKTDHCSKYIEHLTLRCRQKLPRCASFRLALLSCHPLRSSTFSPFPMALCVLWRNHWRSLVYVALVFFNEKQQRLEGPEKKGFPFSLSLSHFFSISAEGARGEKLPPNFLRSFQLCGRTPNTIVFLGSGPPIFSFVFFYRFLFRFFLFHELW